MSEFDFLVPCPSCNERISEKSEICPHCQVELSPVDAGVGLKLKYRTCESCGQKTLTEGPCEHCGELPVSKKEEPGEVFPPPETLRPPSYSIKKTVVLPQDHIPNPLARFMDEQTMARWGFNYELRWTYLIIGVACFFLFRLFFVMLFWQYQTLFNPFNLLSDLIHGVLVGGLVGMRGSGAGIGAKFGALVSFAISFIMLTPLAILAFLGITYLVPDAFLISGKTIFGAWIGLSGASAITGAIVGAFIGFYIEHTRG